MQAMFIDVDGTLSSPCYKVNGKFHQPLRFVSRPFVVLRIRGFGEVPRDMITVSTSST